MTITDDRKRWERAAHAMQAGVAYSRDKKNQEPKHLRVGINCAMSDQAGLVKLLIEKGVFTEAEYYKAIADQMEIEAEDHRKMIEAETGAKIKLV